MFALSNSLASGFDLGAPTYDLDDEPCLDISTEGIEPEGKEGGAAKDTLPQVELQDSKNVKSEGVTSAQTRIAPSTSSGISKEGALGERFPAMQTFASDVAQSDDSNVEEGISTDKTSQSGLGVGQQTFEPKTEYFHPPTPPIHPSLLPNRPTWAQLQRKSENKPNKEMQETIEEQEELIGDILSLMMDPGERTPMRYPVRERKTKKSAHPPPPVQKKPLKEPEPEPERKSESGARQRKVKKSGVPVETKDAELEVSKPSTETSALLYMDDKRLDELHMLEKKAREAVEEAARDWTSATLLNERTARFLVEHRIHVDAIYDIVRRKERQCDIAAQRKKNLERKLEDANRACARLKYDLNELKARCAAENAVCGELEQLIKGQSVQTDLTKFLSERRALLLQEAQLRSRAEESRLITLLANEIMDEFDDFDDEEALLEDEFGQGQISGEQITKNLLQALENEEKIFLEEVEAKEEPKEMTQEPITKEIPIEAPEIVTSEKLPLQTESWDSKQYGEQENVEKEAQSQPDTLGAMGSSTTTAPMRPFAPRAPYSLYQDRSPQVGTNFASSSTSKFEPTREETGTPYFSARPRVDPSYRPPPPLPPRPSNMQAMYDDYPPASFAPHSEWRPRVNLNSPQNQTSSHIPSATYSPVPRYQNVSPGGPYDSPSRTSATAGPPSAYSYPYSSSPSRRDFSPAPTYSGGSPMSPPQSIVEREYYGGYGGYGGSRRTREEYDRARSLSVSGTSDTSSPRDIAAGKIDELDEYGASSRISVPIQFR